MAANNVAVPTGEGQALQAGKPVGGAYSEGTPCSDRGRRLRWTGPPSVPSGNRGDLDPTRAVSDWAERESPGPGSMQGGPNGESVKRKRSR